MRGWLLVDPCWHSFSLVHDNLLQTTWVTGTWCLETGWNSNEGRLKRSTWGFSNFSCSQTSLSLSTQEWPNLQSIGPPSLCAWQCFRRRSSIKKALKSGLNESQPKCDHCGWFYSVFLLYYRLWVEILLWTFWLHRQGTTSMKEHERAALPVEGSTSVPFISFEIFRNVQKFSLVLQPEFGLWP